MVNDGITWTTERRKLGVLIPWERNPRRINEVEAERLDESFEEFGQVETVAIGPGNELYDGHQRLKVLMAQFGPGYEVDCRVASRPLSEKEREKLVILLHRGAVGEWDWNVLQAEFDVDELQEWGFEAQELKDAGFNLGTVDEFPSYDDVYPQDQIIEAAFQHFRRAGFPYRRLPVHVCMQEINKLALTDAQQLIRTDTAYQVADTYHPHRFHASAAGMRSPLDAFNDDKLLRRAIRLWIENGATIGTEFWGTLGLVSGTQACSNFRPGFACYLYRKYAGLGAGRTVLDCSTGYGGRLVGAMASGVVSRYVGIDPNRETHEGNLKMARELGFADKIELYNQPAEDVDPELLRERCDFAFTSPPYFTKEHYSDEDTQSWKRYPKGEVWRRGFLRPMLALQVSALKPGCYAIINIADVKLKGKTYPLERWTVEDGQAAGFEHVRTERYELTHRYGAGWDDEVQSEPVIVFRKPVDEILTPFA